MTLKPGTYLGQYEILALLGVGGMGEVYHARDSKLNREVALKLLPEQFARDPERIGRFRREAQVLAQLQHENIALLYNFEETGSARYLVMEYVPGETLRERIRRGSTALPSTALGTGRTGTTGGPVPIEEALNICRQIADGLEHAHEKTIVHRDLKPANVKVTSEGLVKILDFGLAKVFADEAPSDPSDSPTLSAMTRPGTILGTAAYMAPEQARGRKVDKRADTWALGCLLYELLTGQWAFQSRARQGAGPYVPHPSPDRQGGVALPPSPDRQGGVALPPSPDRKGGVALHPTPDRKGGGQDSDADSIPDILGAILHKEPDWDALPAATPPNIRLLLRRCLQKDRTQRLHSAGDARIEIEQALREPEPFAPAPQIAAPTPSRRQLGMWSAGASIVVAIIASVVTWTFTRPEPPTPPSPKRFVINLPETDRINGNGIALSPDGKTLVYIGVRDGVSQLYRRSMDQLDAVPIPGTEAAEFPFISPDGQWVGFFATGKLKKVALAGGPAATLSDVGFRYGASWSRDDMIVFSFGGSGLLRVSAAGGAPQPVTKLQADKGEVDHRWMDVLPNGRAVLFTVWSGGGLPAARIAVLDFDTGQQQILLDGTHSRFIPTGHIVFARSNSLWAVPFDPERLELTGSPAPLLEDIQVNIGGLANYAIADDGSLVYVPSSVADQRRLVLVDRKGGVEPLDLPPRPYESPRFSPDGRQFALAIREENTDIWLYELGRRTLSRLTFDVGEDESPSWSPDGKWVAFASDRAGGRTLRRKLADGSGEEEELIRLQAHAHAASWTPDGRVLAFEMGGSGNRDIWSLPSEGDPSAGSGQAPSAGSPRLGPSTALGTSSGQAGQGRQPTPFLRTPQFSESQAKFSPDGRWIAYASDESGRPQVYVQPYPGPGGKRQISAEGGTEPVWARNGQELFFRSGNRMMVVDTTTQPTFSAGTPKALFEGQYLAATTGNVAEWDVTPDGRRFLMIQPIAQEGGASQIQVVLNWFEELKRRVPAR